MRGLVTVISFCLMVSFSVVSEAQAQARSEINPADYYGEYRAEYGRSQSKAFQFTLGRPSRDYAFHGDLNYFSRELGACSSENNRGGRADYGYVIVLTSPATKLQSSEKVVQVYGTIFCEKGWYQIAIEFHKGSLLDGRPAVGAFYIQDSRLKTIASEQVQLTRISRN